MLSYYQVPTATLWQGRKDSLPGERYFQCVECINLQTTTLPESQNARFALLGFCCDAGIKRNQGRAGAAEGPSAIRKALANLSLPWAGAYQIYDVGNITCDDNNLEAAQQALAEVIGRLLTSRHKLVVLGGGHEIAWPHYQGIRKAYPSEKIGIINLDAHFDLRPLTDNQQGSSGTPFLQIANQCKLDQQAFSYLCIGIQEHSNTASLWQTAADLNVEVITARTLQQKQWHDYFPQLKNFLLRHDVIYLTLCLDVFAASVAPGVSAPQALGVYPWHITPLLEAILQSGKVIAFDIAELSPPHDINNQTAQLAANLVADYFRWSVV